MSETRNIVFLGASYAGLNASHYFLRHVYPHLPTDANIKYKVLVIDPSSKFFARHASPRGLVRPDLIPLDKMFQDIEPGFKQYGDKVTFVQGKAVGWDEKARTVTVSKANGQTEAVGYWALILATGSKTQSPLHALQGGDYKDVEKALKEMHNQVSSAKEVVIIGGGAAGVETAGELGDYLNGAAGWFSSSPSNPKAKITLITSASKLLPELRQSLSDQAVTYLHRVGVEVKFNTKAKIETSTDSKPVVVLHDGEELHPDIVIPAMGVKPMSDYVPSHLKNERGYIIQNASTLRIDAAGPRVYAFGDVGSSSHDSIFDIVSALPVLETNIKRDLLASHLESTARPTGKDRVYERATTATQIVPVGRSKGVGEIFGWRVPSLFVWLIKGRDFMIGAVPKKVSGEEVAKESVWKGEAK